MEQTQLAICILLAKESSDFWSTAESIATVVSIVAVAAASIYRSSTMTPIEKLCISGMDRVWMRIVEGVIKIFLTIVFLLIANIVIPTVVMYLVKLNTFPGIIFWFCRVCLLLALFVIVLWRLKPQFDYWISKLKSWTQREQGSEDIVSLIYQLYTLFVFSFADFLSNVVMFVLEKLHMNLNQSSCIIFWICCICLLLAWLWIFICLLESQFHLVSKLKRWMQKAQGSKDIVSLIYLLYALFVFPILSYNLIKGLLESFDIKEFFNLFQKNGRLINLIQEKWGAVLFIFIVEWAFFISLGIPGFIINFKRQKAYMKILNLKDGEELFVYFKEDNMLVCGESEDIAKEGKYHCINMEEVDDEKYILKNNDGDLKGQKN